MLDGEALAFNMYDKTRLLLTCASIVAARHLLGINGILLDAMVHLAAVAENMAYFTRVLLAQELQFQLRKKPWGMSLNYSHY